MQTLFNSTSTIMKQKSSQMVKNCRNLLSKLIPQFLRKALKVALICLLFEFLTTLYLKYQNFQ